MKAVLGFTNVFYTLWWVGEPYKHYTSRHRFVWKTDIFYQQNLSKDLSQAQAKMTNMFGSDWDTDLELRGQGTIRGYITGKSGSDLQPWQVPNGPSEGQDIRTLGDEFIKLLWALYLDNTGNGRRRIYARRRLKELGVIAYYPQYKKYLTPKGLASFDAKAKAASAKAGHHWAAGDRIETTLTLIFKKGFDGQYGWWCIQRFVTDCGKEVVYKGSSPVHMDKLGTVKVKATVKHGEYNGEKQTILQRIKVQEYVLGEEELANWMKIDVAEKGNIFTQHRPWEMAKDFRTAIKAAYGTWEAFYTKYDWAADGLDKPFFYFKKEDWAKVKKHLAEASEDAEWEAFFDACPKGWMGTLEWVKKHMVNGSMSAFDKMVDWAGLGIGGKDVKEYTQEDWQALFDSLDEMATAKVVAKADRDFYMRQYGYV